MLTFRQIRPFLRITANYVLSRASNVIYDFVGTVSGLKFHLTIFRCNFLGRLPRNFPRSSVSYFGDVRIALRSSTFRSGLPFET